MSMPGMPDHTQGKLHVQTVAFMNILLHIKSKNFLPQIVFEVLKLKKLCNLIGREDSKQVQLQWTPNI